MDAVVGWLVMGLIAFGIWRLKRAFVRMAQEHNQRRSEAFSEAVSQAVASGVASALSAAVADATAAATGGNVAVHIGDNLARILANDDDRVRLHGNQHVNDSNGAGNGSVQRGARRGELEGGRSIRGITSNRISGGRIHSVVVPDQ